MRKLMLLASIVVLSACKPAPSTVPAAEHAPTTSQAPASTAPTPTSPATPAPATTHEPAFANKVWRVQSSSAGEPGSTYAFLANGTLVIDSPHGTPLYGKWNYDEGKLVMTEEGMAYPTDILKLDDTTFQIRSHNPGGSVDLMLVPAPDVPLPSAETK